MSGCVGISSLSSGRVGRWIPAVAATTLSRCCKPQTSLRVRTRIIDFPRAATTTTTTITQHRRDLSVVGYRKQDHSMAHQTFPSDLPVPKDDGAYDHLNNGYVLPSVPLPVAQDPARTIDLSKERGLTVVFCYPRTGAPGETISDEWNSIPGARGCTPQACSFRDNISTLKQLGVSQVFGISTQSSPYQAEVHERLHLPYDLLSDEHLTLQKALNLPTIDWQGTELLKRSSIAVKDGKVLKSFYPVFPPDKGVDDVVEWLKAEGDKL